MDKPEQIFLSHVIQLDHNFNNNINISEGVNKQIKDSLNKNYKGYFITDVKHSSSNSIYNNYS